MTVGEYLMQKWSEKGAVVDMEQTVLACPLASTYLLRFMTLELNAENLLCFFDVRATLDHVEQLKLQGKGNSANLLKKLKKLEQVYIGSKATQEVNLPANSLKKVSHIFF